MAGPVTNVAEITPLIERYAAGDHTVGDKIFELLKPRLDHMAGVYSHRTRMLEDDLKAAAYEGMARGLHDVNVHIGQPHEWLCKKAWWHMLHTVRDSDYWGKTNWRPDSLSFNGTVEPDDLYADGDGAGRALLSDRNAQQIVNALSEYDEYNLGADEWWKQYCKTEQDIEVVRLYMVLGTYEAVAQMTGVTKQAICARFKRMSAKARKMGHDNINHAA